ncbi:DUF4126 domain-containing protein [Sphingomonas koreensis]|nr:DUF4126 domain-containing protein [Sphingomonas koreensis]
MLRSILIGLVAGQRAMTPLAVLAGAARRGALPYDNAEARMMRLPLIAAGGVSAAAAEMAGDKMTSAPDRTVMLGLLARTITGGFAGATLAPPKRQVAGAALGAGAAIAASYAGLAMRRWAMRRWGQTATGVVEDLIVFAAANAIVSATPARA